MISTLLEEQSKKTQQAIMEKSASLNGLDSRVFVEIPAREISDAREYRKFLMNLEMLWIIDFNGNDSPSYEPHWNEYDSGIGNSSFGQAYFWCIHFHRFDGMSFSSQKPEYAGKRGYLFSEPHNDAAKVHLVADNLCEFLTQNGVEHTRMNYRGEVSE